MGTVAIYFVLFAVIAAPVIWCLVWRRDFDGFQLELSKRERLTPSQFREEFYRGSVIAADVIDRLLSVYADQWQIDSALLRPSDNLFRIYDDLDTVEFFNAL